MKTLFLTLALLSSPLAQAASNVNVIIDGESYSCSKGGGGGGNMCECVIQLNNSYWSWEAYKRGVRQNYNNGFSSREPAENECNHWIRTNATCYQ